MNFSKIVSDLHEVVTLQDIADAVGLASKTSAHRILHGIQKDVTYDTGVRLLALHRKHIKAIEAKRGEVKA